MTAWSPLPSTMATDVRPTTTVVSAAVPPENQVWFTVSGRRVASLLLFFVLSETAGVLRSGARTYFYRTGAVCNCPQLIAPGEDGWSGSSYCGDSDGVIGFATRLSANLLFLQVGVDFLFTPVFAALADKWSCVGVIAIHIGVGCLALAGYSATAKQLPAAASAWHTEHHGVWDSRAGWDLEHPLAANGTNCTADDVEHVLPLTLLIPSTVLSGLAGATLGAPSMALVLAIASPLRKGTAALVMLALRGVGALLGSIGAIVLITQARA